MCVCVCVQIHKWVNAESMLEKCYIGKLEMASPGSGKGRRAQLAAASSSLSWAPVVNLHCKSNNNEWCVCVVATVRLATVAAEAGHRTAY